MRRTLTCVSLVLVALLLVAAEKTNTAVAEPDWSANISNIEACSCPAFCQCYFTGKPASHGEMEYCRFNNAFKFNKSHWGDTKLDDVKFWMSGDLGGDFSKPPKWVALTFEPSASPQQREAATAIIGHVFAPLLDINAIKVMPDATIEWRMTDDGAIARLDNGKAGEIRLRRATNAAGKPATIDNLQFWSAPRNDGVKIMPNEIQAYRLGDHPFETKGTNGFVTTIDMNSKDVKK